MGSQVRQPGLIAQLCVVPQQAQFQALCFEEARDLRPAVWAKLGSVAWVEPRAWATGRPTSCLSVATVLPSLGNSRKALPPVCQRLA